MIEDEAQGHRVGLGPVQIAPEGRLFLGRDIDQVPLPGAQRVFRRATAVQVAERGLVGGGQCCRQGQGRGLWGVHAGSVSDF